MAFSELDKRHDLERKKKILEIQHAGDIDRSVRVLVGEAHTPRKRGDIGGDIGGGRE